MTHAHRTPIARALAAASLAAALALAGSGPARADDLKDARQSLAAGQLDQAQQLFEKAASQGYAEGRAGVGQVLLKRHQYDKAREQFELAQKMDNGLAMAWYGLGEVALQQDDEQAALPNLQKAVELDHKFPEAQLALGNCLMQLKQLDNAVKALAPGLNWGSKWRPRFLIALGDVEVARDSLRDAGIYYTQAQQESPDDPETNRALGDFYLDRGTYELAIPYFEKAVGLDSTDVEMRYGYGRALAFTEHYAEAIDQYTWVTNRDPDFAPAQYALGDVYYRAGQADPKRYGDALPFLQKYTQLKPKDPRGWSLLGRDEYFLKQKDAAVPALEKAIALGDKSKEMYNVLGRTYVDSRDWQKALDAYAKGDPNATDQMKIGQVEVFLGNNDAADSVYRALIAHDSTSSEAKFALGELGKLRFRLKDYPGTIAVLKRRIALDPNDDEAYYYTGLSYKEMKQIPEAVAALRQAATLAPAKGDRQFWLGVVLSQADSSDAADEAFQRSVAADSTSRDAAIALQQLGYHQLLHKNWAGAIGMLERSAVIDDKSVQTLIWLAQAYQNSGNRVKAVEYYHKVLQLQPGQPDAAKGLKTLGA